MRKGYLGIGSILCYILIMIVDLTTAPRIISKSLDVRGLLG